MSSNVINFVINVNGNSIPAMAELNEDGTYYVTGVEIEFGQNGAKRKVALGKRLS